MMNAQFYSSLLLILLTCCPEKNVASKIQFQTFDMSHHLSSASICNRASTAGFKNRLPTTVLEVAHMHSPCVQTDKNRPLSLPSVAKILANDQLRVKYIQARAVKTVDSINTNKDPNKSCRDRRAQLPAQLMKTGQYFVTIGLGTPERNLAFSFDTGSEITWTQCKPCLRRCYRQKDPIFDPSASTTYSNISCKSKDCPQDTFDCYDNVTCIYGLRYGDKSYSYGFLSKDKLTITPTDLFKDFLFGCGQYNNGTFGLTDGLLGLDRGPRSFVSQTAEKYKKYFSYCLPSTINSTGFLSFGKNNKAKEKDDDDAMIFTPFVSPPLGVQNIFYYIEITAISVGGTRLKINGSVFKKTSTIIDSGATFTYLPQAAYSAMSKNFKKQMNKYYKSAPTYKDLDTCFHIPKHTTIVKVPTVSFTFLGNATINLDASGILYAIEPTYACLAFAVNSNLAIFGNTQQKKFEVAYDVAGNKLGFAHNPPGCQ